MIPFLARLLLAVTVLALACVEVWGRAGGALVILIVGFWAMAFAGRRA